MSGATPRDAWLLDALPGDATRIDVQGDPELARALAGWGYVLDPVHPEAVVLVQDRLAAGAVVRALLDRHPGCALILDERLAAADVDRGRSAAAIASRLTAGSAIRAARAARRLRRSGAGVRALLTGPRTGAHTVRPAGVIPRPGHAALVVRGRPTVADTALAAAEAAAGAPLTPAGPIRVLGSGTLLRHVRGGDGERALRVAAGPGRQLLERAAQVTDRLRSAGDPALAGLVVPTLARGEAGRAWFTLEPWITGAPPRGELDPAVRETCLSFLAALAAIPAGGDRVGAVIARDAAAVVALADDAARPGLERLTARLEAELGALPCIWMHGDFWPGNLIVDDGRLAAVIDWDGATPAGVPLADALHLMAMTDRRIRRLPHGGRCVEGLLPLARSGDPGLAGVCERLGVAAAPASVEALVVAYWLGRVARDVRMFADRQGRSAWMEQNVWAPLRAFGEAGW